MGPTPKADPPRSANPVQPIETSLADLPACRLVIGFSGGLDSTVLLHALATMPLARNRGLRALHIDHGLHPGSGDWAQHCRETCAALDIPLDVAKVDVASNGSGPEAAARHARWQAFDTRIDPATEMLALAHHRDDQAETVLLRLLRGAGPAGLSAMRPLSTRSNGLRVWRPLLGIGRPELSAYADASKLNWLDDPSNATSDFDRNYLRHAVLPHLRERWPETDAVFAQAAKRQADAWSLERQTGADLLAQAATVNDNIVRLTPLRAASRPARWAALRSWLERWGARDLGAMRLQCIDTELIDADDDAEPRIDLGTCVLRRYRDELHALEPGADHAHSYRFDWDGRQPLVLPNRIGVLRIEPPASESRRFVVTSRQGGERIRLHANGPRRELKHVLQELGVAPWSRARWPVLWLDDEVAAFADIAVAPVLRERLDADGARLRFESH